MAKYNVTLKCGHEEVVELFGPMKERENKINWMQVHKICKECWRNQQEQKGATLHLAPIGKALHFILNGNTYPQKDKIKKHFQFRNNLYGNVSIGLYGAGWISETFTTIQAVKDFYKELKKEINFTLAPLSAEGMEKSSEELEKILGGKEI